MLTAEQEGRHAAGFLAQGFGHRDVGVGSVLVAREVAAVQHQPGMARRQRFDKRPGGLTMRTGAGPEEVQMNPPFAGSIGTKGRHDHIGMTALLFSRPFPAAWSQSGSKMAGEALARFPPMSRA
jgi:hypothetical protein